MSYDDWKLETPPEYATGEAEDPRTAETLPAPPCSHANAWEIDGVDYCLACGESLPLVYEHACGASYTRAAWVELAFAYLDTLALDDDGDEVPLVFRHCECGSTIGIAASLDQGFARVCSFVPRRSS